MAYEKKTNLVEEALGDVKGELRRAVDFAALLVLTVTQEQELEDSASDSLVSFYVDDAVGDQLDILGRVVDQDRVGLVDEEYRAAIRGKVRANKSNATLPALLAVMNALFAEAGVQTITPFYPACFEAEVASPILTPTLGEVLARQLTLAKGGGICGAVRYSTARTTPDLTNHGAATLLDGAQGPGGTTLTVDDTTGFPDSGRVIVSDNVIGTQETVAYSSKTATTYELDSPLVNAHLDNAQIRNLICWVDGDVTTDDSDLYSFARATYLDGALGGPIGLLTVDSTEGFPDSGNLILSQGTAVEESVPYTSKTATTFTLAFVTTFAHPDNAAVTLDDGVGYAGPVTFCNAGTVEGDNLLSVNPSPDSIGINIGDYVVIKGNDPASACIYEVTINAANFLGIKPALALPTISPGDSITLATAGGGQYTVAKEL